MYSSKLTGAYWSQNWPNTVGGQRYVPPLRVEFDLSVGVDAEDYDAIAIAEELSPLEIELRKLEDAAVAVNKHMNYMRQREAAMRDTNGKKKSKGHTEAKN